MNRAGYVLVGGRSSRMGCDKALLPFRGSTLAVAVAAAVRDAAGSATLVGDPARYGGLGFPVIPDRMPGGGPLAGIHTALLDSAAEWNLVVACDMPAVSPNLLSALLEAAWRAGADALLPHGPSGRPEPLCAVYHARCAASIGAALHSGVRKVMDGLSGLNIVQRPWEDDAGFQNCNTPEEWAAYRDKTRGTPL